MLGIADVSVVGTVVTVVVVVVVVSVCGGSGIDGGIVGIVIPDTPGCTCCIVGCCCCCCDGWVEVKGVIVVFLTSSVGFIIIFSCKLLD